MKRNIFALLLFLLIPFYGWDQQLLIDSLQAKSRLPNTSTEQRVKDLADLSMALRNTRKEEAVAIAKEALQLSWTLKDKQYASYVWSRVYYTYRSVDSIAGVLDAKDSVMWYAKASENKIALGNAYRIAGNYAYISDDNTKAADDLLQAFSLLENTDNFSELANICYMLNGIFAVQDNLESTEQYARFSLSLTTKTDNPDVRCLSGLSMINYFELSYKKDGNLGNMDSAIYYSHATCNVFEKYRDVIKEQFSGGTAALNCASFLWMYYPDTPKDTVFNLLKKAITWASAIRNYSVTANCYALMSEYISAEGDFNKAENILLESLKILQEEKAHISNQYNIVCGLLRLAEKEGDKDKIIKYQRLFSETYKKVYDEKQNTTLRTLEAQYNHKKKEQEIIALQKQANLNKKINYFSIGIASLIIIILFLVILSYRLKVRSALQKKNLLEAQTKDALLQKQLKEEETLRLELEQELMRQQNEQLRKEVFAGTIQLQQKNELLETVRKEISNDLSAKSGQVHKIIQENLQSDDYFEEYKSQIKDTHPHFFQYLQSKAGGKLTDLDLKYCTYIYMKISSKQMAGLLHVEYNSIRMNKYRIKQKFGLQKEDDLDQFIRNVPLSFSPDTKDQQPEE